MDSDGALIGFLCYTFLLFVGPLPSLLHTVTEVLLSDRKTRRTGLSGCLVLLLRPSVVLLTARLRLGLSGLPRSDLVPV